MNQNTDSLRLQALLLLAAPEVEASPGTDPTPADLDEFNPTDEQWLAMVALLLTEAFDGSMEEALFFVDANRRPALHARGLGFEPWEVAQFIEMKVS